MAKFKITFNDSFIVEVDDKEQAKYIGNDIRTLEDIEFQIEEVEEDK